MIRHIHPPILLSHENGSNSCTAWLGCLAIAENSITGMWHSFLVQPPIFPRNVALGGEETCRKCKRSKLKVSMKREEVMAMNIFCQWKFIMGSKLLYTCRPCAQTWLDMHKRRWLWVRGTNTHWHSKWVSLLHRYVIRDCWRGSGCSWQHY